MVTNLQKLISKTNFFSEKNFRKAVQIANELEFMDFGIDEENKENNWFGLFLDENNAYWTIQMNRRGTYGLYVEDEKICAVGKELEAKIDSFREDELGAEERSVLSHREYLAEQNELWRNFGPGKN
ncbi:hypothetical protein BA768_01200 [Chryseobacterium sp. CBo1]|uniref:hypothetical protein n=1 Tax=Chryseobacterium sp. CBo1 TaxID=1869230 RepID=UPI000810D4EA|nr:hypothetical protein [Chryseobacterium sp. CBo1]OCK53201.1 hypothetical protein BA768_01200 [Chryseobacterium sp. CBo1]